MSQQSFCDLHLLGQMSSGVGQSSVWALDQNTPVGGLALLAKLLPICSRLVASLNRYNRKNNYPTENLSSTRSKLGSCWPDLTYNLQYFSLVFCSYTSEIRTLKRSEKQLANREDFHHDVTTAQQGSCICDQECTEKDGWFFYFILRCQFLFTTSKYAQQWMRQVWRQEIHFI